jgi:hypothetical protein
MRSLSATGRYVRNGAVVALGRGDRFVFCGPRGEQVSVSPVDGRWLSDLLSRAAAPVEGRALLRGASRHQVETLAVLLAHGVLQEAAPPPRPARASGRVATSSSG